MTKRTNELAAKIRQLRRENDITMKELGNYLGVSKDCVQKWESGERVPRKENIEAICDYFNVDMNYVYGYTTMRNREAEGNNHVNVPLYDISDISSPPGNDDLLEILTLPKFLLPEGSYIGVCMNDNSMIASGLKKGDLAIFEKNCTVAPGTIGLFSIGGKTICRTLVRQKRRTFFMSANRDYDTIEVRSGDYAVLGRLAMKITNERPDFVPSTD